MSGYLICLRVDEKGKTILTGSKQFVCVRCKCKVWVTRASQHLMITQSLTPICLQCVPPEAIAVEMPTKDQLAEIFSHLNRN